MKKQGSDRILFIIFLIFSLGFLGSINANSASVEINGKIGGEMTADSSRIPAESDSTDPPEELALPNEDTILLGWMPDAAEHSIDLLAFISIGVPLLFALASNGKSKADE